MFVLKQLRRKKRINQTDLALAIGVSLRTIQLYEKKNANIPIKNLTKIANYFGVTIAELYSHEVNEDGSIYNSRPHSLENGFSVNIINDKKQVIHIPLVTSENHSTYGKEFHNQDFLEELPSISFMIEDFRPGNYLAFEILGNSMENSTMKSIPNKAIVLGKEVKVESNDKSMMVVLICEESILCKELIDYDKKTKVLTCHSLNTSPEYSDFKIPAKDVKQVFQILKKQTD